MWPVAAVFKERESAASPRHQPPRFTPPLPLAGASKPREGGRGKTFAAGLETPPRSSHKGSAVCGRVAVDGFYSSCEMRQSRGPETKGCVRGRMPGKRNSGPGPGFPRSSPGDGGGGGSWRGRALGGHRRPQSQGARSWRPRVAETSAWGIPPRDPLCPRMRLCCSQTVEGAPLPTHPPKMNDTGVDILQNQPATPTAWAGGLSPPSSAPNLPPSGSSAPLRDSTWASAPLLPALPLGSARGSGLSPPTYKLGGLP